MSDPESMVILARLELLEAAVAKLKREYAELKNSVEERMDIHEDDYVHREKDSEDYP